MARLSAARAPATPDQTEESEERLSTGAGAIMATSNASINARQRDNASPGIRGQAVGPKAGKLPRRSRGLSHVVSGQRRLGRNTLADANTYNVSSDDEPAPSKRQAATTTQFSPLKRQIRKQSREEIRRQEERERQAALNRQLDLDWERESERVVEDIESRREGSKAGLSGEDAAVHEASESGFSGIQSNADAEGSEILINALKESVPEPPQQSATQKKRGRPRKSRPNDKEQEQASEQSRRKRGRPSNAERAAEARRTAAHEAVEELIIDSVLAGMTDELSSTSPPQVAEFTTAPAPNRRLQRSLQTAAVEPVPVPSASNIRPRQASIENVARNGLNSRHRVSASTYGDSLFVQDHDTDRPDIVRPTELGDMNSVEDNDQTLAADEQFAGEEIDQSRESTDDQGSEDDDADDDDDDEDEDGHMNETESRRWEEQQLNEELKREMAAREEDRERQVQWRKLELHNQDKWKRMNKARFDVSKNSGDIKKQHHLRSCGMQLVQTDAEGQPYLPATLRGRRGMWTEHESTALEASLRNHVDTPAPLESMVFEKIIAEECKFRRPLANKNVLEIVIEANEIKYFWINWRRDTGAPVDEWVQKIPRWIDPPRPAHDNGISVEDAIEIE